jgi:hypothetical protein
MVHRLDKYHIFATNNFLHVVYTQSRTGLGEVGENYPVIDLHGNQAGKWQFRIKKPDIQRKWFVLL